ncbi:MAG: alpha/beta fold hydrolase [Pyrinomonadaceae bacterium]
MRLLTTALTLATVLLLGPVVWHSAATSRPKAPAAGVNSPGLSAGRPTGLIDFQPAVFVTKAGESVNAEQGWLVVPESRSRPQGGNVKLPVLRFKSTAEKPGYPIVYLAGGPGASGVESAKGVIFPVLAALRERADVIVFDQRGTGDAEPSLVLPGRLDIPPDATLDSPAARRLLVTKAREAAAEIRRRGTDLSAYNTNENADDVNDLRLGLGAQKITIWGHSYGSHLGLAVLRRHGQFIHRAILGGVNGPDQRWRYPEDLQSLVERVGALVKNSPKLQRQMPNLGQTVAEVLKRLGEKPASVLVQSQPVVIGRKDVEVLAALQAGDLEFVKALPYFFGSMKDGNFSQVGFAVLKGLKQRELGTAMRYSMHIASGVSPERAARIERQKGTALFGDAINFPFDDKEFVDAWGVGDLGADFRAPFKSDVPTLFLSGTLDGRTSLEDAEEVRRGFADSQLVIVEGAGHDPYHLTPKVPAVMLDFLDGKRVPERIAVPLEIRGPDERKLILELRKLTLEKGAEAGVKRMREMNDPKSDAYLTTYVIGTLGFILANEEKKPEAAFAFYQAGVELFPENEFLNERLADAFASAGMKERARGQYQRCLELNPLNRSAYVKLSRLVAT